MLRNRHPARRIVALVLAVVLVGTACEQRVDPIGEGPLRYRDAIFDEVTVTSDIVYGSAVTQAGETIDLIMDVYEPVGDTLDTRPVIVFAHGGAFFAGDLRSGEIVDQARYHALRGYVTVSISYRLSENGCLVPNAECLRAIGDARDDATAAIVHLRTNAATYGIDTSRVAMAGTSAGAITALNVAYSNTDDTDPTNDIQAAVSLSGAAILTTPDPGEPPALLFHGTADTIVPYTWAQDTLAAAEAAGVRAVETVWEGEGHVPYVAHRTEILEQTRNFLWWRLGLYETAA